MSELALGWALKDYTALTGGHLKPTEEEQNKYMPLHTVSYVFKEHNLKQFRQSRGFA